MMEKIQSDSDGKKRWKQFINTSKVLPTNAGTYTYPVTDRRTNDNVEKQDPGKLHREKSLYRKWLDREWQVAVDFGCGIGANFPCFDRQQNKSKFLIGLDPDRTRVGLARNHANRLRYVEAVVTCADVSMLEDSPDDLLVDVILCSQVLGHVPKRELGRILRGFAAKLRAGGSCAVSVPVVGGSFTDDLTARGWVVGDDFTHLVYLNRSPFEKDYRKCVPDEVFDQYAVCSPEGVLPVRCFWMPNFLKVLQHDLPTPVPTAPPTLARATASFFEISEVVLYAVHANMVQRTEEICIGDALIILTKT